MSFKRRLKRGTHDPEEDPEMRTRREVGGYKQGIRGPRINPRVRSVRCHRFRREGQYRDQKGDRVTSKEQACLSFGLSTCLPRSDYQRRL